MVGIVNVNLKNTSDDNKNREFDEIENNCTFNCNFCFIETENSYICINFSTKETKIHEGADMVRGRGEMRGREGEKRGREEGEEGAGGGRRGGGRREKRGREERGREEGEGRKKGREGERGNFCARFARAAPEGRRETRGREGGGKGAGGGRGLPPCPPPHTCTCFWIHQLLAIWGKLTSFGGIIWCSMEFLCTTDPFFFAPEARSVCLWECERRSEQYRL